MKIITITYQATHPFAFQIIKLFYPVQYAFKPIPVRHSVNTFDSVPKVKVWHPEDLVFVQVASIDVPWCRILFYFLWISAALSPSLYRYRPCLCLAVLRIYGLLKSTLCVIMTRASWLVVSVLSHTLSLILVTIAAIVNTMRTKLQGLCSHWYHWLVSLLAQELQGIKMFFTSSIIYWMNFLTLQDVIMQATWSCF